MRTLMTNATRLHVCQRCPRLLRRYAQGEKRAAFEGLQGSGVKYGSLFHKYIAEAFHRDASGPQNPRREALCAALAGDVSGLPGRLREYVDRYCYEPFLEKHSAEHSTEVLLSLAAGAERWIRSLAEFLGGVPPLCANPRALMPQVFCLSEQRLDADYVFPDGKMMRVVGKYDALLFNPETGQAEIFEFKGYRASDTSEELAQTAVYAWLIYSHTGVVPSVRIIYLEDDAPLRVGSENVKEQLDRLPQLFDLTRRVMEGKSLPKAHDESICGNCAYRAECESLGRGESLIKRVAAEVRSFLKGDEKEIDENADAEDEPGGAADLNPDAEAPRETITGSNPVTAAAPEAENRREPLPERGADSSAASAIVSNPAGDALEADPAQEFQADAQSGSGPQPPEPEKRPDGSDDGEKPEPPQGVPDGEAAAATPAPPRENFSEQELMDKVIEVLATLKVHVKDGGFIRGPSFIRLKVIPDNVRGTTVKKIENMATELKVHLPLPAVPVILPQTGYVSVDVPRVPRERISVENLINRGSDTRPESEAAFPLGVDIDSKVFWVDLAQPTMTSILIGGTSGSGKSVLLRAIVKSLCRCAPKDSLTFTLIDPKIVTFADMKKDLDCLESGRVFNDAGEALKKLGEHVDEMEARYRRMADLEVQDITACNASPAGQAEPFKRRVIIIDEYADMMLAQGADQRKELERVIQRIGQKGRAAGMHLILATQRPDAQVVTPVIKANLQLRIALKVAGRSNSQIILGDNVAQAQNLLGYGDMFVGSSVPLQRLQGAFA